MADVPVTLEFATVAHALELAPRLRPEDVAELEACGVTPEEGLRRSIEGSDVCVAARFGAELAYVFGAKAYPTTTLGHRVGCAWFLTGQACSAHPKALVRSAKALMPGLQAASGCAELRNWVDARYTGAVRLMERLGFQVLATAPFGPQGLPFCLVSRRAD